MAGIYFDARINGEQLQRDIADINKQLKNLTGDVEKAGKGIDSTFRNLGGLLAGYFTFNFAGNMVKQIAQVRGEFQQLEVAFETMLGNKARADALMADVVQFAAVTPFTLQEVATGAKSLMAFGTAADEVLPTLKALGDVAAGLSVPVERLILNFGQVKTQTYLTGRELRDFNIAGVPIIAELAKNLGVAKDEIIKMTEAGKIGFKDVEKAFTTMSSEGGRFANLMDKQAKTIVGLQSNLRDAIDQMFNSIGESQEGAISSVLKTAISLVENYEKVIDILKVLVVTYGAYKAALMTVAAWQAISTKYAVMDIATKKLQVAATLKAAAAQMGLNTAMKLNPYVLAAAGIAAFVTILTTSIKKKREAAQAAAEFADSLKTETYNVNKAFDAIKNTTEGTKDRAKAIQAVNTQYGTYLPAMLTEASTLDQVAAAQRGVTAAIIETISTRNKEAMLKPAQDKVNDAVENYKKKVAGLMDDMVSGIQKGKFEGQLDNLLKNITERAKSGATVTIQEISRAISTIYKNITNDEITANTAHKLAMRINEAAYAQVNLEQKTKSLDEQTKEYLRTLGLTDQQIGTTSEQISRTVSQQIADTTKAITDAQAELNRLRQPNSVATEDQIKAQEDIIKDLRGKLETLTGITKKAAGEQLKIEEEKLKAQQELADKLIGLDNQTQAARIAIMEDGTRKQIAEIDLQLKQEIQSIEAQRRELLAAAKGSTDYDTQAKVINTNSDTLLTAVNTKAAQDRIKIERDANKEIIALRREVTDAFLSDQDREIAEINAKYGTLLENISMSGKATSEDWERIMEAWGLAMQKINAESALNRIEFEEDIEVRRAEIAIDSETNIEKRRIAIYKKYAQQRLTYLKTLGTAESKMQMESINVELELMDKRLKDLSTKSIVDIAGAFREISGIIGNIDDELGTTISQFGKLASDAVTTFASISSGNILGGITGAFGVFEDLISLFDGDQETQADKMNKRLEAINKTLEYQSALLANLSGENWFELAAAQVSTYNDKIEEATSSLQKSQIFTKARYAEIQANFKQLQKDFPNFYGRMSWATYIKNMADDTDTYNIEQFYKAWKDGLMYLDETEKGILEQGLAAVKARQDLMNQMYSETLGFTSDSIAESIMDGLKSGYDSAEDFANNFEKLMKDAIYNAIMTQILNSAVLKKFYEKLYEYSEGGFTKEEIEDLKTNAEYGWNVLAQTSSTIAAGLKDISGLNFADEITGANGENKLTGAVKGITEETAGIIAGQFYAMRENLLAIKSDTNLIRELIPLDLTYSFVTIRDNAVRMADTLTIMNTTQHQMAEMGLNQLASINETVGHLASIDKKVTDIAKLNSIDARLEEMNRNIKNL